MSLTRAAARHRNWSLDLRVTEHHIRGVSMVSRSIRLKIGAVAAAAVLLACVFAGRAQADAKSTPPGRGDGDAVSTAERTSKAKPTVLRAAVEKWRFVDSQSGPVN